MFDYIFWLIKIHLSLDKLIKNSWSKTNCACTNIIIVEDRTFGYLYCCCCCLVTKSCLTLCDHMIWSTSGLPVPHYLPEFAQVHCPLNQWYHPAILFSVAPSPSAFNLSSISVFSNESAVPIRWPNYWSFSFSISPSNEYTGLISFRTDLFGLPAVQGTFKSLLQHHNSKASILQCSAFFIVQLSYPYMTIGKYVALTIQTFLAM